MLSSNDISQIELDMLEIISDWADKIQIWNMLPADQQPGWNPVMREIVGEPEYDKIPDVPAERRNHILHSNDMDVGGVKDNGVVVLCIPTVCKSADDKLIAVRVNIGSVIILDDEKWYVDTIEPKLGEILIQIKRYTGR